MFDMKKFLLTEFEGVPRVEHLLDVYAATPASPSAIAKWFQRGSITGVRLAELLCIQQMERGTPVSVIAYWEVN